MNRWVIWLTVSLVAMGMVIVAAIAVGASGVALWLPSGLAAALLLPLLFIAAYQRRADELVRLHSHRRGASERPSAVERRCCETMHDR